MGVHNPLSEARDAQPTTKFREALSEADDFIRRADGYAEAQVRVDELTELVRRISELHRRRESFSWPGKFMCETCLVIWPCPTMELVDGS